MGWTKRQYVNAAYEELGYSTYQYDLDSEQLQLGMKRLDSMLMSWNNQGVRLGYAQPSSPQNGDLDTQAGTPDRGDEAIYTNLAIRIAPSIGKTAPMELKATARNAFRQLIRHYAQPIEKQFPDTLPRGAGNKAWRWDRDNFMNRPEDPIDAGPDGIINFY